MKRANAIHFARGATRTTANQLTIKVKDRAVPEKEAGAEEFGGAVAVGLDGGGGGVLHLAQHARVAHALGPFVAPAGREGLAVGGASVAEDLSASSAVVPPVAPGERDEASVAHLRALVRLPVWLDQQQVRPTSASRRHQICRFQQPTINLRPFFPIFSQQTNTHEKRQPASFDPTLIRFGSVPRQLFCF